MLKDVNGISQQHMGNQPHWQRLTDAMMAPQIYGPLLAEVSRIISEAIATDPARPQINSREASVDALDALGPAWQALFAERFQRFPHLADHGVFGMALWFHIVNLPDTWYFSGVADPYGSGQDAIQYWRP
ncbi:hypothetical protein ACYOEI_02610 [Singulisphaera rosea]